MGSCQSCLGGNDSTSSTLDRSPSSQRVERLERAQTSTTRVRPSPNQPSNNRRVTQTAPFARPQNEDLITYERLNQPVRQVVIPVRNVQPTGNYNRPTFTLGSGNSTKTGTVQQTCHVQPKINDNRPIFTIGSGNNSWVCIKFVWR